MRERKQLQVSLDPQKDGAFTATFATLNVVDSDKDVTVPGAFKDGQAVRIARWGHNWSELPVGKGIIHADDAKATVVGQFFLDTTHGKDTYLTVKQLADLQEWSYGYDVLDSEAGQFEGQDVRFLKSLDVIEVSPVMLGAGIGTRTESIKSGDVVTLAERIDAILADTRDAKQHARNAVSMRAKEGRTFSRANETRLRALLGEGRELFLDLEKLLEEATPKPDEPKGGPDLARMRLEGLRRDAAALGIITT